MLEEIHFTGVKDGVADDGPFEFRWENLGHGLWAMLTDKNLRGKSSVIEVVRWLLRGKPSLILQDDVRRWIHKARIRFRLDEVLYEVTLQATANVTGTLLRFNSKGNGVVLAPFASESEFEGVMAQFFMRELGMDTIMVWQRESTDKERSGQTIAHGWAAFSGAMFIGTSYEVLLGDLPVEAGLNPRLIQMYLGLPWVSTLAASRTAHAALKSASEAKTRKRAHSQSARQARVQQIAAELATRRLDLSKLPSDEVIRDRLSSLSLKFADAKRKQRTLEERLERETSARRQVEAVYKEDRRDLQTLLDSIAAGAVFRMLDPTCCPRCDHEITDARRKQESTTRSCSVCGEVIPQSDDTTALRNESESRVQASKSAYDRAAENEQDAKRGMDDLQDTLNRIQAEMEKDTALLGSFAERQELRAAISVLEGRLQEAAFDPEPADDPHEHELSILDAIIAETDVRVSTLRQDLLLDVSRRIVEHAQRFGMHSLSEASLRANGTLSLVKGGVETSYSKLQKERSCASRSRRYSR